MYIIGNIDLYGKVNCSLEGSTFVDRDYAVSPTHLHIFGVKIIGLDKRKQPYNIVVPIKELTWDTAYALDGLYLSTEEQLRDTCFWSRLSFAYDNGEVGNWQSTDSVENNFSKMILDIGEEKFKEVLCRPVIYPDSRFQLTNRRLEYNVPYKKDSFQASHMPIEWDTGEIEDVDISWDYKHREQCDNADVRVRVVGSTLTYHFLPKEEKR